MARSCTEKSNRKRTKVRGNSSGRCVRLRKYLKPTIFGPFTTPGSIRGEQWVRWPFSSWVKRSCVALGGIGKRTIRRETNLKRRWRDRESRFLAWFMRGDRKFKRRQANASGSKLTCIGYKKEPRGKTELTNATSPPMKHSTPIEEESSGTTGQKKNNPILV